MTKVLKGSSTTVYQSPFVDLCMDLTSRTRVSSKLYMSQITCSLLESNDEVIRFSVCTELRFDKKLMKMYVVF